MPFVRYSRDKRGYEQIWLVHTPARRGRPAPTRVLYWYRSPPGVRVGREPFDAAVRARLEAQYPDIRFDWDQLAAAAVIPPVEVEPWRERRRAQREARRSRPAAEDEETLDDMPSMVASEQAGDPPVPDEVLDAEGQADPTASATEGQVPSADRSDARPAGARRRRRNRRRRPEGGEGRPRDAQAAASPEAPSDPTGDDPTDRPVPSSDS